jgi:hypothetical protein
MSRNKKVPFVVKWRDAVMSNDGPKMPSERLVLLVISTFMNGNVNSAKAWPSYNKISSCSNFTRAYVVRLIQKLKDDGWIDVKKMYRKGNNPYNIYTAKIPKNDDIEGDKVVNPSTPLEGQSGVPQYTTYDAKVVYPSIPLEAQSGILEDSKWYTPVYPNRLGIGKDVFKPVSDATFKAAYEALLKLELAKKNNSGESDD